MKLAFTKMSGAGNDFVVVDNRDRNLPLDGSTIAGLCDRHFGIGADGLLAVESSENGADYRMRYYNADGGEADMCGNGARCFARFVHSLDTTAEDGISFATPAGIVRASYHGNDVEISLTPPTDLRLNIPIQLAAGPATVHYINTGVPHIVQIVDNLEAISIREQGRELRCHEAFTPTGANANFVAALGDGLYGIRTYERGVEDETLACGTGVCAAAIIAHLIDGVKAPVRIQVRGGDILHVGFQHDGDNIHDVTLRGPATVTFSGEVELDTLRRPTI